MCNAPEGKLKLRYLAGGSVCWGEVFVKLMRGPRGLIGRVSIPAAEQESTYRLRLDSEGTCGSENFERSGINSAGVVWNRPTCEAFVRGPAEGRGTQQ